MNVSLQLFLISEFACQAHFCTSSRPTCAGLTQKINLQRRKEVFQGYKKLSDSDQTHFTRNSTEDIKAPARNKRVWKSADTNQGDTHKLQHEDKTAEMLEMD